MRAGASGSPRQMRKSWSSVMSPSVGSGSAASTACLARAIAPAGNDAMRAARASTNGRSSAGGWSQQRFARRRANQADGLVHAAVESAARILLDRTASPSGGPAWLVTGGDKPLVEQALADPRLRAVAALARGPHLTVGDPKRDLVDALPALLRQVSITLSDTGTRPDSGNEPGT